MRETLFDALGTTKEDFYRDFLRSTATVRPQEVIYQVKQKNNDILVRFPTEQAR